MVNKIESTPVLPAGYSVADAKRVSKPGRARHCWTATATVEAGATSSFFAMDPLLRDMDTEGDDDEPAGTDGFYRDL